MKFSRGFVLSAAVLASSSPSSPSSRVSAFAPSSSSSSSSSGRRLPALRLASAVGEEAGVASKGSVAATPAAAAAAAVDDGSSAAPPSSSSSVDVDSAPLFREVSEPMDVAMPMTAAAAAAATENVRKKDRIEPGRYDGKSNSIAVPFLKRPSKLDGSHAGDYGFDPLGLTEHLDLYAVQESEVRHARLAMLAVVGWPVSELVAPERMLQDGGRAPSVLNGFNPLSFVAALAIFAAFGAFDYHTALRKTDDTQIGRKHAEDMADVWKYGVAGDYDFDPLGLYSSLGDSAAARRGLRDVEIGHGRMAMLGIASFAVWEELTGHAVVENSMFFHPNLLLPALVAGYAAFSSVYEIRNSEDGRYVLQVEQTDEGKARVESWKLRASNFARDNAAAIDAANRLAQKAFDAVEPAVVEPIQRAFLESQMESSTGGGGIGGSSKAARDAALVEQAERTFEEYCRSVEESKNGASSSGAEDKQLFFLE